MTTSGGHAVGFGQGDLPREANDSKRVTFRSQGEVRGFQFWLAGPHLRPSADDAWLVRWLPLLREQTGETCVLELGCGEGRDTAVLHGARLRVVALDRSSVALAKARRAVPGATFIESDLRAPLPIEPGEVGALVASLSLHYFDSQTTRELVDRIRACVAPERPLLCRVNSLRDVHHGATRHPSIEPGYFRVGTKPSASSSALIC